MLSINNLSKPFQTSVVAAILAMLVIANAAQWFENREMSKRIQEVQASATLQIVETERQCNRDKEDLRRELIEKYKADIEKLEKLTNQFRQLKSKR